MPVISHFKIVCDKCDSLIAQGYDLDGVRNHARAVKAWVVIVDGVPREILCEKCGNLEPNQIVITE